MVSFRDNPKMKWMRTGLPLWLRKPPWNLFMVEEKCVLRSSNHEPIFVDLTGSVSIDHWRHPFLSGFAGAQMRYGRILGGKPEAPRGFAFTWWASEPETESTKVGGFPSLLWKSQVLCPLASYHAGKSAGNNDLSHWLWGLHYFVALNQSNDSNDGRFNHWETSILDENGLVLHHISWHVLAFHGIS